jgi:hypothetical protein
LCSGTDRVPVVQQAVSCKRVSGRYLTCNSEKTGHSVGLPSVKRQFRQINQHLTELTPTRPEQDYIPAKHDLSRIATGEAFATLSYVYGPM